MKRIDLLNEIERWWPAIRWSAYRAADFDGWEIRGRQHGRWALRRIEPRASDFRQAEAVLANKVFAAAAAIADYLALFDEKTKRLSYYAPRRAR